MFLLLFLSILFATVVAQTPSATTLDLLKCPCVMTTNQTGCMPYDSRFQAFTLEEAMASFPDLTIPKNETDAGEPLEAPCDTPECQRCQEDLKRKLEEIGVLMKSVGLVATPSMPTVDQITDTTAMNLTYCPKYRFTKHDKGIRKYGEKEQHDDDDDDDDDDSDDSDEDKRRKKSKKHHKRRGNHDDDSDRKRKRRQAAPPVTTMQGNTNVLGTRYPLSCTTKGVSTDSSGYLSLCSSCWVWRKLPDNYSPQYINELVCDDADNACLSGYATCGVGHRTMDVIRDDGNGVKTTVALTAGTYCECKVLATSAITSLVTGAGVSSSLPALTLTSPAPGK